MLQLKDFKIKDYQITIELNDFTNYVIYSEPYIVKEFIYKLAGINLSQGCLYKNKSVFDNELYFRERVFIDCELDYVDTLIASKIAKIINERYGKILNSTKLNKYVRDLQIRGEGQYHSHYNFTPEGKALLNTALGLSLYGEKIFYCPLDNIIDFRKLNILKEDLRQLQGVIIGCNKLTNYQNIFDYLIVLKENNVHLIQAQDNLLVIDAINDTEKIIKQLQLRDLLISHIKDKSIVIVNKLNGSQLKELNKYNLKRISPFQLEEYL